jgi:hypothetical protein
MIFMFFADVCKGRSGAVDRRMIPNRREHKNDRESEELADLLALLPLYDKLLVLAYTYWVLFRSRIKAISIRWLMWQYKSAQGKTRGKE